MTSRSPIPEEKQEILERSTATDHTIKVPARVFRCCDEYHGWYSYLADQEDAVCPLCQVMISFRDLGVDPPEVRTEMFDEWRYQYLKKKAEKAAKAEKAEKDKAEKIKKKKEQTAKNTEDQGPTGERPRSPKGKGRATDVDEPIGAWRAEQQTGNESIAGSSKQK